MTDFHDDRNTIKGLVTVSEVLRACGIDVGLRKRMRCPLQYGRNPQSFSFTDTHYRCFSCEAHGDVIALAQALLRVNFTDALAFCAQVAGIDLKRPSRAAIRRLTRQRKQVQGEVLRTRLAVEDRWEALLTAHHAAQANCKFLEALWSRDRDADDVLTQHALDDLSASYMRREVIEWELEETTGEFSQLGSSCQLSKPRESEITSVSCRNSPSIDELILQGLFE